MSQYYRNKHTENNIYMTRLLLVGTSYLLGYNTNRFNLINSNTLEKNVSKAHTEHYKFMISNSAIVI